MRAGGAGIGIIDDGALIPSARCRPQARTAEQREETGPAGGAVGVAGRWCARALTHRVEASRAGSVHPGDGVDASMDAGVWGAPVARKGGEDGANT